MVETWSNCLNSYPVKFSQKPPCPVGKKTSTRCLKDALPKQRCPKDVLNTNLKDIFVRHLEDTFARYIVDVLQKAP